LFYITSKRQDSCFLIIIRESNKYEEDMIEVIDNILFEMLVCAYLCISVSRYFKIDIV